jgi:hypothetical protein
MALDGPPDDDGSDVGEQVEVSFGTFTGVEPEPEPELAALLPKLLWNWPGGSCQIPSL